MTPVTPATPGLICRTPRRNAALEPAGLAALDEVDVEIGADGGVTLTLFFTGPVPARIGIANVVITGGRPVKITGVRPARRGSAHHADRYARSTGRCLHLHLAADRHRI